MAAVSRLSGSVSISGISGNGSYGSQNATSGDASYSYLPTPLERNHRITPTMLSVQHSHEPNEIAACVDESCKVSCGRDGLSVRLSFILFSEGVSDTNIFFAFGVRQGDGRAGVPGPGRRRIHGSSKTTWFTIPRRFPRLGRGGALSGPGLPTRLF